jgi:peptidoglycan/xylan/chitin deacetylase (PgdA/CDA1 family)
VIAKADRHLWPESINTPDAFDKASRASILIYLLTLQQVQGTSNADLRALLKVNGLNRASVDKWLKKQQELSFQNYQRASGNCTMDDWTCVGGVATSEDLLNKARAWSPNLPRHLLAWRDHLHRFSHAYAIEQMRLATLFPKVSSEIDRFNEHEWNGDGFADRQFFLTFDDGPSRVNGETDDTVKMLNAKGKSAVFFVLGGNFQNRLHKTDAAKVAQLYKNQCIASHGWEHRSHAKWSQWQDSVKRTQSLLKSTIAQDTVLPLFRPPYGQRKADSGAFFQSQSLQVALWNLDSQDWNAQISANDLVNRIIALMLIKRHGVLLFHDIRPKAKAALPTIFDELGPAVDWGDCRQLARVGP